MLRTLAKQRRILLGGLAATLCASGLAFWLEQQNLRRTSEISAAAQIAQVRQRLDAAQMEMEAVLALLAQPDLRLRSFDSFVSQLTLSRNGDIRWILGGVIPAEQALSYQMPLSGLLGKPDLNLSSPQKARYALPVLATRGSWPKPLVGENFASQPAIAGETESRLDNQAAPASRFRILTIDQPPFSEGGGIWFIGTARDALRLGGLPAASLYVVRGVSSEALKHTAGLSEDQILEIAVLRADGTEAGAATIPAGQSIAEGVSRRLEVDSNQLVVTMTPPAPPHIPRVWILVGLLGIATTMFVAALRAGFFMAASARSLSRDLETTQSQLDASSFREAAFFENTSTACAEADAASGRLLRVNQALCDMLGYTKEELLARRFQDLTHPEELQTSREPVQHSGASQAMQFETRYIHKNGTPYWCLVRRSVYRDRSDAGSRFLTTIVDITDRKNDEMLRNNLVRELAHRVRNTVQIMSSLARQTAKTAQTASDYDEKFRARLAALSAAQDALFDSEWRGADLRVLVHRTLAPFFGDKANFVMPALSLPAQHAQTLAIALNELASSALHSNGPHVFGLIAFSGETMADPRDGVQRLRLLWREPTRRKRRSVRQDFGHALLYTGLPEQFEGHASSRIANGIFEYEAWLGIPRS